MPNELFDPRLPDRFWDKVMPIPFAGCWVWMSQLDHNGYGQMSVKNVPRYAHRLSFVAFRGDIPEGLEIDHACRVPACCNPNHLEAVTHSENMLRGARKTRQTHCKNGHPLSGDNLIFQKKYNRRVCRVCRLSNNRISYHRVKNAK